MPQICQSKLLLAKNIKAVATYHHQKCLKVENAGNNSESYYSKILPKMHYSFRCASNMVISVLKMGRTNYPLLKFDMKYTVLKKLMNFLC